MCRMAGEGTAGRWFMGIAFVVIGAAIVGSIFFLIPRFVPTGPTASPTSSSTPTPPPNGGAVPEDENEDATKPEPGPGTEVVPFITNAVLAADGMSVTVYSFVPALGHDGGVCRASVVGGAESEVAEGPATIEVADTTCPPLVIQLAAPAAGGLQVQVEYNSETASGVSEPVVVQS